MAGEQRWNDESREWDEGEKERRWEWKGGGENKRVKGGKKVGRNTMIKEEGGVEGGAEERSFFF